MDHDRASSDFLVHAIFAISLPVDGDGAFLVFGDEAEAGFAFQGWIKLVDASRLDIEG